LSHKRENNQKTDSVEKLVKEMGEIMRNNARKGERKESVPRGSGTESRREDERRTRRRGWRVEEGGCWQSMLLIRKARPLLWDQPSLRVDAAGLFTGVKRKERKRAEGQPCRRRRKKREGGRDGMR